MIRNMSTNIYLARHGETVWNQTQRLQGHLDSPLTAVGQQQALTLASLVANYDINHIISSPLGRAIATANLCQKSLNIPLSIEPQMIERNLGDWQGQQVSQLQSLSDYNEVLQQVTTLNISNGESALACARRIHATLIAMARQHLGTNVLVILHGEALRCFMHQLGRKTSESAFSLYPNGKMITLSYCSNTSQLSHVA